MLSPVHAPTVRQPGGKGPRGRRGLRAHRDAIAAAQGARARRRRPPRRRDDDDTTIGGLL